MIVVIDIWTGPKSQTLAARYIRLKDEALKIAKFELYEGNLVNLRVDTNAQHWLEFDNRGLKVH